MKTREQMQDVLIDDTIDTCLQDSGYMRSIIQEYFKAMPDEEIERYYRTAIEWDMEDEE